MRDARQTKLVARSASPRAGRPLGPLVDAQYEDNRFYGTHAQIDWKTPAGTFTVLSAWRRGDKHNLNTSGGFIIAADGHHLGSGLIDHSQKMTVAAIAMAEKKVWAQRS